METKRPTTPEAEEILGLYYPVLDHGFVSLVDYMGSDESVEHAARVSYGYGTRKRSQTRGLIRYLRRHLHTTPSEMVEFKFHCAMPMFVARQWIRHRTACLAAGTELWFDLPGGMRRRGNQLYKLKIKDLYDRFQPTENRSRPDKQRNPHFRRDRVRMMNLRQANEDTYRIQHTRVVDVYRNGVKPVFRMTLADGKQIEATADHRFLFEDGWSTLRQAADLRLVAERAVWNADDLYVHANGVVCEAPARHGDQRWSKEQAQELEQPMTAIAEDREVSYRTHLVGVVGFEYVGERETYDVEVEGPYHNFVANGVVTHNSVNEYSGRYSLMPLLFYSPQHRHFSLQSASNNQGREAEPAQRQLYEDAVRRWEAVRTSAADAYTWMVEEDVARELARIDLPLSTYTQWYWKIDLHNLLHFLTLRVDDHAQWEIQEFGRVMAGMLKRVAPMSYEAWIDYQVCGAKLGRAELEALALLLEPTADGGLTHTSGRDSVTSDELKGLGLAPREARELAAKLQTKEPPEFDLDLSRFRTAEEVAMEMHEAVPGSVE